MAYRARLDHDRIFWGVEEVEALGLEDVGVPADCDLAPGMYRHNAEATPAPTFEALPREARKAAPEAPSLEMAFFDLLEIGPDAPRVRAWKEWFVKSFDARPDRPGRGGR